MSVVDALPTTATITVLPMPFPRLEDKNQRFLALDPNTAGRAVILEIYPTRFVNDKELDRLTVKHGCDDATELGARMGIFPIGTSREAGWRRFINRVDFPALGHAAQCLEHAGVNWRSAVEHTSILEAFARLPQSTN